MRNTEYWTSEKFVDYINTLESLPDPIVVISDYQHRVVWLNIRQFALPSAVEFLKRNGIDAGLERIHLEVFLDDSEPGWRFLEEYATDPR